MCVFHETDLDARRITSICAFQLTVREGSCRGGSSRSEGRSEAWAFSVLGPFMQLRSGDDQGPGAARAGLLVLCPVLVLRGLGGICKDIDTMFISLLLQQLWSVNKGDFCCKI